MSITLELVIIEFIVLAIVCVLLIRYYKGNMVTLDVAAIVYLSWILGFAGILLLPYDISVAVVDHDLSSERKMLDDVWNFIYWSTFCLAWGVLPLQMEYHNSGQFTFLEKLQDAVMKNLSFYIFAGFAGTVYVVYMVSTNEASLSQVISFLMAMGNTYGVFLITVLMGSGLVGLPRRLWQTGDVEMELRRLYMQAPSIECSYQEARYELEDCELVVDKAIDLLAQSPLESTFVRHLGLYVSVLETSVAKFEFAGRATTRRYVAPANSDLPSPALDTKKGLVELHARLKQAQMRARASERRWKVLVQQSREAEKLLANEPYSVEDGGDTWCTMRTAGSVGTGAGLGGSSGAATGATICTKLWNLWSRMSGSCSWHTHTPTAKLISRCVAVVCALVSVVILWSELVMASQMRSPVGLVMGAYSPQSDQSAVVLQGVAFLALSYMSICTYWSLFQLNLGWAYRLQGPQQSLPASLIFNGEYFSRLQFALGYNFLLFLNVPATDLTSFNRLMSNITIVPVFGTSFTVYMPIIMIVVALMTLFNVFTRLFRLIGVEGEDATGTPSCYATFCGCFRASRTMVLSEEDLERFESGKKLVANYIRVSGGSGNGGGGGASTGSTVSGMSGGDRGRGKADLRAMMQRGGAGLGGRRAVDEADDDQEGIDLSTGSHTRRELLPAGGGGGGRYAHMGLSQSTHEPKNPTKVAGSQGPSPPVASAPTSASWSTHIGSVFSGLTQQVQATTSSGPSSSAAVQLVSQYSSYVRSKVSIWGGHTAAPLSGQDNDHNNELFDNEIELANNNNNSHGRATASVTNSNSSSHHNSAKVAVLPSSSRPYATNFGLEGATSKGSTGAGQPSQEPKSTVYVGRYANV